MIITAMQHAVLVQRASVKSRDSLGYGLRSLRKMAESTSIDFENAKNAKGKSAVSFDRIYNCIANALHNKEFDRST